MKEQTNEANFKGVDLTPELIKQWLTRDLNYVQSTFHAILSSPEALDTLAMLFYQNYLRDKERIEQRQREERKKEMEQGLNHQEYVH